jgi:hypothetical protein
LPLLESFASLHSASNVLQSAEVAAANKFKEVAIFHFQLVVAFVGHLQASMASVNLSVQAYWTLIHLSQAT